MLIRSPRPGAQEAALVTSLVSEKSLSFPLSTPLFSTITAHRPRLTGGFDNSQIKCIIHQLFVALATQLLYQPNICHTRILQQNHNQKNEIIIPRLFFKHKTKINGQDNMSLMKSPSHMDTFCIKNSLTELQNITFKRIMTTFTKNLSRHVFELTLRH